MHPSLHLLTVLEVVSESADCSKVQSGSLYDGKQAGAWGHGGVRCRVCTQWLPCLWFLFHVVKALNLLAAQGLPLGSPGVHASHIYLLTSMGLTLLKYLTTLFNLSY